MNTLILHGMDEKQTQNINCSKFEAGHSWKCASSHRFLCTSIVFHFYKAHDEIQIVKKLESIHVHKRGDSPF